MPIPLSMLPPAAYTKARVAPQPTPRPVESFEGVYRQLMAKPAPNTEKQNADETAFFGSDGFGPGDLIDIINPLQHLPIISMIYRRVTGDEISPGAKLIGGTLLGGPIGFASSAIDMSIRGMTGKSMGDHVLDTAMRHREPSPDPRTSPEPSQHSDPVDSRDQAPTIAASAPTDYENIDTTVAYFGHRPAFVGPTRQSIASTNPAADGYAPVPAVQRRSGSPDDDMPGTVRAAGSAFRAAWAPPREVMGHPQAAGKQYGQVATLVIDSTTTVDAPRPDLARRYAPPPRWS